MAVECVLKIKQTLFLKTAQQHDVFGMIIAQHGHTGPLPGEQLDQHLFPGRAISSAIDRQPLRRTIPLGQQPDFAHILAQRVVEERPRRQSVQFDQRIDCGGIYRHLVTRPFVQIVAHPYFAEIFEQDQPACSVFGMDPGSAQRVFVEPLGRAQEGFGILVRRRRVHQHRGLLAPAEPEVTAERGIAGQRLNRRLAPTGAGKKGL